MHDVASHRTEAVKDSREGLNPEKVCFRRHAASIQTTISFRADTSFFMQGIPDSRQGNVHDAHSNILTVFILPFTNTEKQPAFKHHFLMWNNSTVSTKCKDSIQKLSASWAYIMCGKSLILLICRKWKHIWWKRSLFYKKWIKKQKLVQTYWHGRPQETERKRNVHIPHLKSTHQSIVILYVHQLWKSIWEIKSRSILGEESERWTNKKTSVTFYEDKVYRH